MKHRWMATAIGAMAVLLGACAEGPDGLRPVLSLNGAAEGDGANPLERGKAYFARGQYGLALEAFRDALAEDPASARALNAIAASFDQLQRFDLADRYYERALMLEPQSPEVLNNLGYSHLLRGNLPEARKYLALAARAEAGNPVIEANLTLARREDPEAVEGIGPTVAGLPVRPEEHGAQPSPAGPRSEQVQIVRVARGVKLLVTRPFDRTPEIVESGRGLPEQRAPAARQATIAAAPAGAGDSASAAMLMPAAFRVPAPETAAPAWRIEVSNGTGRSRMAARMRQYLGAKGMPVKRLTNDASFSNEVSRITYRPGAEAGAAMLRAMLPADVVLEARDDQHADVRLVLGADLLNFDAQLIKQLTR